MTLDAWLAIKGLTRTEFGRMLGLRCPWRVSYWTHRLVSGEPNRKYLHPSRRNQLKIRRATNKMVSLDDWPPAPPPPPRPPISPTMPDGSPRKHWGRPRKVVSHARP